MDNSGKEYWQPVKRVFRYPKGTSDVGRHPLLIYTRIMNTMAIWTQMIYDWVCFYNW